MPEQSPYTLNDLFKSEIPQSFGTPVFGNTPSFQNAFTQQVDPNVVGTGEQGENIKNYGRDIRYVVVNVGENIQDAIDKLNVQGGGVISLQTGVHIINYDITLYSGIYLEGVNRSTTVINFNGSAKSILVVGTGAYSTGTVSVSNSGTTVTGSGTAWLTNASAGQFIMLNGSWYPIASVDSDTQITIALPFAEDDLSGVTYVLATIKTDVQLKNFTVKGSASSGIKIQYARQFVIDNVNPETSALGVEVLDSANGTFVNLNNVANFSGFSFTRTHYCTFFSIGAVDSLTGVGVTLNGVTNSKFDSFFVLNSAANGFSVTSCVDVAFIGCVSVENGGKGFELISGNTNVALTNIRAQDNASDGIKLTATSDGCPIVGCSVKENGGYGINIAAASCDENILVANIVKNNTSGGLNDLGTSTISGLNVGI